MKSFKSRRESLFGRVSEADSVCDSLRSKLNRLWTHFGPLFGVYFSLMNLEHNYSSRNDPKSGLKCKKIGNLCVHPIQMALGAGFWSVFGAEIN